MRLKFLAALLALVCVAAASLPAQESRGTILGRVTDSSGAVVPGAEVRATSVATQAVAVASTNDVGNFTIPFLLPGAYVLTVQASGFRRVQREGIQVRVNDTLEVNVQLTVGEVTETVDVTAESPLLETTNVSLGQVMDQRRVTELPLQAGNAFELVLLAPGVLNATDMRMRKAAFNNAPSQITTDGNAQYSNDFTIDGVTNTFSSGTQPRVAFSPPASAVGEFKVQTTTFDAALGHTPGSVVNVSTTSGTNRLRGEVHHWLSNSALDAWDLFQKVPGATKKPVYQDNRFGFSLGGPVYLPKVYTGRNKTFFFYAYELNKWGAPGTFIGTVPTEPQLQGDFSSLLALGNSYRIYDPATARLGSNGRITRTAFDNNVIPAARIDSVAKNMMKFWPAPNRAGTADGRNNYGTATKALEDYYVHLVRIDHNFSEKHRMYGRVHYDWWEEDKNNYHNNASTGIILNRINRGVALDDVYVLSPTSILNLRYGLTQQEFPERRTSRGFDLASLGFSPTVTSAVDGSLATFPRLDVSAYSVFGGWESGDGTNTSLVHSFTGNLTKLKGNHNLRYGAEYRVYREFANRFQFETAPDLAFSTNWTRGPNDNSAGSAIGQDLASFLLGLPTSGEMRRSASAAEQDQFFALYVHDDWKVTRKLTLNLGVRYEYESPITERFDRSIKGFDFATASPLSAAALANYTKNPVPGLAPDQFRTLGGLMFAGGSNGRSLWEGQKWNFMPRLGIAYQLTPKTVLRTGYGIFYETIGVNRNSVIQAGFTRSTPVTVTQDNGLTFIGSTANPFPLGLRPVLGPEGGLRTNLGQGINFYPGKRVQPYAQRWSFGLQRQLPASSMVEATYVGNRGTRLGVDRNINAVPASLFSTKPERDQEIINRNTRTYPNPFFGLDPNYTSTTMAYTNFFRPFPHFGDINQTQPIGYSWYHALQLRGEKRFSQGYTLQGSYAWSKLMEATEFLNPSDALLHEVIAGLDRTHRVAGSAIWELPFGKGRKFGAGMPGWANQIAGGWQLNLVVQRQSGAPLGFGNSIFRGRADDIVLSKGERTIDRYFNTNAGFEKATGAQLAQNIRTMPLRFSWFRGLGQARWDISALKNFLITETVKLEFRAEAYNAWNNPNIPNNPNTTPTNSAFGTIRGQVRLPRQFQLAMKLSF